MNWLGEFYERLWFAVEFRLTPVDRRPFTFIMRDFFNLHPIQAWSYTGLGYIGLIALHFFCPWASWVLFGTSCFVLAHVVWGAKYIEHQQEFPEYLGE